MGERQKELALRVFFVLFHNVMEKNDIPRKTIYRLSIYNRALQRLKENGVETVSSEALATAAAVKPTQLRKDLTYFGQWGTRGLGYSVNELSKAITEVLGMAKLQPVILVGAGQLGTALLRYGGFAKEGFEFVAAFDQDTDRKRPKDIKVPILPMEQLTAFIQEKHVRLAILTVPGTFAQAVANTLIDAGIQAILNFAPAVLQVPERVVVNNVDLAIQLENLSYFVK
jgi:redox-sensing transcriptional repressor